MENIRGAIEKSTGKELPSASEFRKTASAVFSGKEKMTAGDWMKGGLLGKMLRDRKEASVKEEPAPVVVTDFQDKVKAIVMTKPIGTSKKVVALLKEYGWSKVREVPEDKQEEFLQKVEAL